MHHYIWVYWDQLDANCWKPDTAWNGSTHTCTYLYQTACALYDAPEDVCILHPKHVE